MPGCRRFTLTVAPTLSGVCYAPGGDYDYDPGTLFGDQYDEDGEQPCVTLAECMLPDGVGPKNRFMRAAAEVAMAWVRSDPEVIFGEITNREQGSEEWEFDDGSSLLQSRVSVEGVDCVDGKLIFTFAETTPGDLTPGILDSLVKENHEGGDTWDCGDFGDINITEAAWKEKIGALESSCGQLFDPTKVQMRLSMAGTASWSLVE